MKSKKISSSWSDTNRIGTKGSSFYYPRLNLNYVMYINLSVKFMYTVNFCGCFTLHSVLLLGELH